MTGDERAALRAALAAYERARTPATPGAYAAAFELFEMSCDALPALLDAADELDRLRAEMDRRVAAGTKATVDAVSALSQRCGELVAERDLLTEALHAARAHPDWLYCGPVARSEVEGLEADGWERNEPAERARGLMSYRTGTLRELRRRKPATP